MIEQWPSKLPGLSYEVSYGQARLSIKSMGNVRQVVVGR